MEKSVEEVPRHMSRKRTRSPSGSKREKSKKLRYSSKRGLRNHPCGHNTAAYKCNNLSLRDLSDFNGKFYATPDKLSQDNFIIKYCKVNKPIRKRTRSGTGKAKMMSLSYSMKKINGEVVPVCRETFLQCLQIKKGRLRGVVKRFMTVGCMSKENRGGDRKSARNAELTIKIKDFIKKFKGRESHYCRSKSKRIYLPSELTITAMFKMFKEENMQVECKESFFCNIFNRHFNISFKHPRSDMCSTCLRFKENIKVEKQEDVLNNLKMQLSLHLKRSQAYYKFLEEKDSLVILSFDCQKNQVLPKVPDQAAYYSRQLYIYNFTVVVGSSLDSLTKENVFIYAWTEDEQNKASNQISSAIFHCLTYNINLENIKTVRLMADGCGGQNKNSIIIGMASKWLSCLAPPTLKKVEMIYPETGHSFLPADRVFGSIEKDIRGRNIIVDPEECIRIFENHGTVMRLGRGEVIVYDWKNAVSLVQKETKDFHFKITQCKRFVLSRLKKDVRAIVVRGEKYFNSDTGSRRCLHLPNKTASDIRPQIIANGVAISTAKLNDVKKLLEKHYGSEWHLREDLNYYVGVLNANEREAVNNQNVHPSFEDDDECCAMNQEHTECENFLDSLI